MSMCSPNTGHPSGSLDALTIEIGKSPQPAGCGRSETELVKVLNRDTGWGCGILNCFEWIAPVIESNSNWTGREERDKFLLSGGFSLQKPAVRDLNDVVNLDDQFGYVARGDDCKVKIPRE